MALNKWGAEIDILEPAPKIDLTCINCGKVHTSGYLLSQCPCYDEIYDACLG